MKPVRWISLGALALAAIAAFVLSKKTAPVAPVAAPDAGAAHASIALFDDGAPMRDRIVVFQDARGQVLATTKSGADGKATGPMPSGGMITVAYGESLRHLVTIAGVEPNDEVLVGEKDNDEEESGDTSAVAKITLPGAYPKAARYGIELGLGSNGVIDAGAPLRLPVMRRYLDGSRRFHVLGVAYDADGGALAYAHGTPTASDAGDTDVTLPPWQTDWEPQRIRLVYPNGLGHVKVDFAMNLGEARFDYRATAPLHHPDTNLTLDVPRALGRSATYRIEAWDGPNRLVHVRRDKDMPSMLLLNLSEGPRVAMAERRGDVVSWRIEGDPAKAHTIVAQLSWPETKEHVWTIVAPPATTAFELPRLPKELASWAPGNATVTTGVALVEASEYAGYADVKKKWIHLLSEPPEEDAKLRMSLTGPIDL